MLDVENNMPEVGKFYHFWDDRKQSISRHYICKCERIITPEEAKNLKVEVPNWDFKSNTEYKEIISLYDRWKEEVYNCDWLYNDNTDYFIECSCPQYDENNLWFVRTKYDSWFSINIQSCWQAGRLDTNGSIFDSIIEELEKDENKEWAQDIIREYKNCKYDQH